MFYFPPRRSISLLINLAYYNVEFVEAMIEAYPNLEILQLATYYQEMARPFDDTVLSALSFPKLVSLTLTNFKLEQGSFLLKVNAAIQSVYIAY